MFCNVTLMAVLKTDVFKTKVGYVSNVVAGSSRTHMRQCPRPRFLWK